MSSHKRIIIHAGPGKTGSSALQAWLNLNSSELKKRGVLYPKHRIEKNNISSGHIHHVLKQVAGDWKVDGNKVNKLLVEFDQSGCNTLLISSEFFFHVIKDLYKAIPESEFIVYIRNPLELLESNYNQGVKRHSLIHPFHPPKNLERFFWSYLTSVSKKIPKNQLILRPYERSLYIGGSIISDLLTIIGIDIAVESKKINSSYHFPVMEYKRLLNHFGLQEIERELDHALQDCKIGVGAFSLMSRAQFDKLNRQNIKQMQGFVEQFERFELQPLLELFNKAEQKPVMHQHNILFSRLKEVDQFVKGNYPNLHKKLFTLINANKNLLVDNPIIYKVFEIEPKEININDELNKEFLAVAKGLPIAPENRGKVLHHLAKYYESIGSFEEAFQYSVTSIYFNPGHYAFRKHLNYLLILRNDAVSKERSVIIPKLNRLTALKKKLSRQWNY